MSALDVGGAVEPGLDDFRALARSHRVMYLLRLDDLAVVGSSPEALVKVSGERVMAHPIAGTRPRGASPDEDAALRVELLGDAKERAEHVMLVDLGRNDLGRVCAPGSVEVVDFMSVRRYSHVMHLESTVVGQLTRGRTALSIAHRLSTAEGADEVIVFDAGVGVQRGPHAELVAVDGVYRRLHDSWVTQPR